MSTLPPDDRPDEPERLDDLPAPERAAALRLVYDLVRLLYEGIPPTR